MFTSLKRPQSACAATSHDWCQLQRATSKVRGKALPSSVAKRQNVGTTGSNERHAHLVAGSSS